MKRKALIVAIVLVVVGVFIPKKSDGIGEMITLQPKLEETCCHVWERTSIDDSDGDYLIPIQRCTNCGAERADVPRG